MTFLICIFILLMQFLWVHVKDLVGKGIAVTVLAEFFLYAALTMVPMALPLAILLASLMTFGNLGESFELTAMKAAGISLFRIMRPLIVFIALISLGAFYFSNNVLPVSQAKLYALLFSLRQKSPELDIPVGEFYDGIEGRNIYVRSKNGKMLEDLMIYDFSSGFNNATVTTADSGFVQLTADNKYLLLTLYTGESFENINQQPGKKNTGGSIPYRREEFKKKEMLIEFNSELMRYDESVLQDHNVSKNLDQLRYSIDSVSKIRDQKVQEQGNDLINRNYLGREFYPRQQLDTLKRTAEEINAYNVDSLFLSLKPVAMEKASERAIAKANEKKDQINYNKIMVNDSIVYIRRHKIELHRKFTLSFACLIFFFIGAPLGAIIRKGGLGLPAVISVLMFIVYYIIDNTGYKMAREGIWEVYQGMWLSSAILLPVGVFLTYKAANDAVLFNSDGYKRLWENLKTKVRRLRKKDKVETPV